MTEKLTALKQRLQEISDLTDALGLLSWDQSTYMPPGAAAVRGRQQATLGRLVQEKQIDPEIGRLLDDLRPFEESLPFDDDDASLIRVARRRYEKAIKVPPALLAEFYAHSAESYQAWAQGRPANDFAAVRPYLEKTVDISRRIADCFPGYEHIADPLIDFFDDGMTVGRLLVLFADLRKQLVPLVESIADQPAPRTDFLHRHYPEADQLAFGLDIARQFGYDTERGRLDLTLHPFMTSFSPYDVRITTRVKEDDVSEALFSTLHEAGHAIYEQGVDLAYDGTPLAGGTSSGVHESQSRLWENQVGRSLSFWRHYYPRLQETFPDALRDVALHDFHRAINVVRPSLIRTEADEITYNLHIIIRFDLELALLEGRLAVKDLPEAWHARYESDLGVHAPDDRDGVMQDVHWFSGVVGGAFQGYTLGNLLAAAFLARARDAHPEIDGEMAEGSFTTLHGWLRDNVYRHGSKYTPPELTERVLGGPLTIDPYVGYLRHKYGGLYDLTT